MDHQFSPNDNFYARYSDWRNDSQGMSFPTLPSRTNQRYTNVVGSETHLFSPSFLFTARFTMMRFTNVAATGGPNVAQSTGLVDVFPPFRGRDFLPPFSIAGYASLSQSGSFMGPEYYLIPPSISKKSRGPSYVGLWRWLHVYDVFDGSDSWRRKLLIRSDSLRFGNRRRLSGLLIRTAFQCESRRRALGVDLRLSQLFVVCPGYIPLQCKTHL